MVVIFLFALALARPAEATPPTAPELAGAARARASEVFVALFACEDYLARLRTLRDAAGTPESLRAALPKLIAQRERELAIVRQVADAVRDPARTVALESSDPAQRVWMQDLLQSGPTVLFDSWQNEGAALPRDARRVVDTHVMEVAEKIRPRTRPPLLPLVLAVAAGIGGALLWRRRSGKPQLAERFEGLTPLGAGGMGMVLRARDRVLGRDVAVKVPHATVKMQPDLLARFLREAKALASLDHPAIVRILDVHAEEPVYFTMELIDGGTLHDRMELQRKWTADEALALLKPIASALAACHRAGLVHRDVKPANILIDKAGAVRLSDFGLAFLDVATRLTLSDQVMGTPGYLAPELLEGGTPTPACDVHAWGLMLHDLLSGDPETRQRKLAQRLTADLPPLSGDFAPELAQLVMDCVSRAPERRPADGNALLARLDAIGARREDTQAAFAAAAARLEALVGGPLHSLKNAAERTGRADDPATREALRSALEAVAQVDSLAAAVAQAARALAADAPAGAVADLHRRACGLLVELALPLRPTLEEIVRPYGRQARLAVDLPPPPVHVLDRAGALADLKLCVTNWIDNALQADASRVDVILGGDEREAVVQVRNDGAPFPPELRALLFREAITLKGPARGTGLITVARIARARGWNVSLEDGELTTFRLTIPVSADSRAA